MIKISAIVNTRNEDKTLAECLKSLSFADEIIVVDMESTDNSRDIAYKFTHNVYLHKPMEYVEPARNFALAKATGDWLLIVDPDESIPKSLAAKLVEIADGNQADFVRIPRQNMIFGEWIKHSRWWPDYNIRFFKKGHVEWQNAIHSIPITFGNGLTLEATQGNSIYHRHYSSIDQYIKRSMRYSQAQAKELEAEGYKFNFTDALTKPFGEFLSRFFAGEGYKDGFHGLMLALLQSFSVLLVYLKIWETQGFKPQTGASFNKMWSMQLKDKAKEFRFWQYTQSIYLAKNKLSRIYLKLRRKINF